MKKLYKALLPLASLLAVFGLAIAQEKAEKAPPLKVLVVAGGCCHDYETQSLLLKTGIEERINAAVTIEFDPAGKPETTFPIYESADWAKDYDVIIHDECSANVTDKAYVNRILDAHKNGTPAVNLHCAMHSYRWGDFREGPLAVGAENGAWYEMIGIQSTGHGPQSPIDVTYTNPKHPVTTGMENWTTINEELYNNIQVYEGTEILATGSQLQNPRKKDLKKNPDAKPKQVSEAVIWANEYGEKKTKILSISLGHNNETVADDRYMNLVVRSLLWTTNNLADDGKPAAYAK